MPGINTSVSIFWGLEGGGTGVMGMGAQGGTPAARGVIATFRKHLWGCPGGVVGPAWRWAPAGSGCPTAVFFFIFTYFLPCSKLYVVSAACLPHGEATGAMFWNVGSGDTFYRQEAETAEAGTRPHSSSVTGSTPDHQVCQAPLPAPPPAVTW